MPRYPIYIVSKGRWKQRKTALAFEKLKIPYYIVVEEHQYEQYANVIDRDRVLVLPQRYLDEYDTCDNLGSTKSKGPGAARNFAWDHSIRELGAKRHWVFDDNVRGFYRFHRGKKIKLNTHVFFRCMEDFVDRYENVTIAGMQNLNFLRPDSHKSPMIFNTRIYSMLLIQNDIPFRWRGRYNEDTDLSLRVLKAGWCTIQFEIFSGHKEATQQDKGGNTEDFYKGEGTKAKSEMLQQLHPDVTKLVKRYGRDHHYVNYNPYRKNKLKKKRGRKGLGKDVIWNHSENTIAFQLKKKPDANL